MLLQRVGDTGEFHLLAMRCILKEFEKAKLIEVSSKRLVANKMQCHEDMQF